MKEQIEKRILELQQIKDQRLADYNAIIGAIFELQALLKTPEPIKVEDITK